MSTIPTVSVITTIYRTNGKPDQGATVVANLNTLERYNGFIVPRTVRAVTNEEGKAVLTLFPNELGTAGSQYNVTLTRSDGLREALTVTVPNADCNLHEIVDLPSLDPSELSSKVDKVIGAGAGNIPIFREDGGLVDSGASPGSTQLHSNFALLEKIPSVDTIESEKLLAVLADKSLNWIDVPKGVADHGNLEGLDDDDHPQYLNTERGDGRYAVIAHTHNAYDPAGAADAVASIITAHVNNKENPHEVTAAQVSADPTGTAVATVAAHEATQNHVPATTGASVGSTLKLSDNLIPYWGTNETGEGITADISTMFGQDNTLLKADTAETPISLVVGEKTLVGNVGNGIAALSVADAMPLWAALPGHYERDVVWAASSINNYTLTPPARLTVNVNDVGFYKTDALDIDLSSNSAWASSETMYVTAANRIGLDFYIYACNNSGTLIFLLSHNSTAPSGYDSDTSRKIGGFHCLCADVGTITGHTLSGYVAGDILPASVWDLKHRPVCDPAGMVYVTELAKWVDIYLTSASSGIAYSLYNASVASYNWYASSLLLQASGKRLLTQDDFMCAANGSNVNTYVSSSVTTTGGNKDTNTRRLISNNGLEDCCGFNWQWGKDAAGGSESTTWVSVTDQNGNVIGSTYSAPIRALLGGGMGTTASGPACCYWVLYPSTAYPCRGCCASL